MKPQDITEVEYHYSRRQYMTTVTGKIAVGQVYHLAGQGRGWYVIGLDKKTGKQITLRPANILRRVRVR